MVMPAGSRNVYDPRQSRKAEFIQDRLQVLDRLTVESTDLLDVLGQTLHQLTALTAPIHSRATALTNAQQNIAVAKQAVDHLLEHLETSRRVQSVLEAGPGKDLDGFLDALSQLEHSNVFLQQHGSLAAVSQALAHSQQVFNRALEQCDADFRATLAASSRGHAPTTAWLRSNLDADLAVGSPAEATLDLIPSSVLPKLRRMVEIMLEAGYEIAQQGYIQLRDKVLHQALQELGIDSHHPVAAAAVALMGSEVLEKHISGWTTELRAVTLLLVSEQQLAHSIWPSSVSQEVFARLASPHLVNVVQAGRTIVEATRMPDKVFSLLSMHKHLQASLPVLQDLLRGAQGNTDRLLGDLSALLRLISNAAASLFGAYEEGVARDSNKVLPMDGTIHPLTAQVLSYMKRLLSYENAADVMYRSSSGSQVHSEQPDPQDIFPGPPMRTTGSGEAKSALSAGVARLLMQLLDNLEVKSRAYKNDAIAALFLMNNVHYVQWSVENTPAALKLLGEEWLERHKDAVEDWGAKYHDITWMPLVNMLKT
eukprot:GHUV01013820.1.p1 GENE.GHUV01013820.1~~GHUV01013820.1.p1  ORF type:complete len:538 (+),score=189.34 GHUV01013820.1:921-2534(+)